MKASRNNKRTLEVLKGIRGEAENGRKRGFGNRQ
jgi:hypothetical protein